MRFVLGVDGGASKTLCLLGREDGEVLALGRAGPSNHQVCGYDVAMGEIRAAVEGALKAAGIGPKKVWLGAFFLAGADLPEDYERLSRGIRNLSLARDFFVKNDTLAALRAGATRPWGVAIVCGAGFNAAGRSREGREIVLPGLGPISGDKGGGGWLAQEALRRAIRGWDGRGKGTALLEMILEHLGLPSPEELIRSLYFRRIPQGRLLGIVPLVFEAAYAGDEVAAELLVELGTEVGVTAGALLRRLGLQDTDAEVILSGGVFKGKGPLLLDTVAQVVHRTAPEARVKRPRYEPVVGAFLSALEAIGVEVGPGVIGNLEATLPPELFAEGQA